LEIELQVIIGPATVGGIQAGAFKIGDTAGTIDNIIQCKLYRPGSVGFVSKSVSSFVTISCTSF
jgi:succinyl-CoA synthetase alpha subunit